ncbi:MAG TPA: hypothetical protein VKS22_02095 [Candidatus Binataceae bacterium]|nr:hypothetical protein [Candidatus Binataceae bacterium]
MDYAEIGGYVVTALGGFMLGTLYGRKLEAEAAALLKSLETRLGRLEHTVGSGRGNAHAAATDHHAAAIEQLAGAISKHAAAVDDHGAATVAAAVEHNAAITAGK